MIHNVINTKIGIFKVVVKKPHGFLKCWYVEMWHKHTWIMTEYNCTREQIMNSVHKEVRKLKKELRMKKFRMEYCR